MKWYVKTEVVTELVIKCSAWFQVRVKTGTKDLITITIKDMGTTIVLTVIKATVAMEDMTILGTTIPITDMDRDTQITVVSDFDLRDRLCIFKQGPHTLFGSSSFL